jgi:hypothetical protein
MAKMLRQGAHLRHSAITRAYVTLGARSSDLSAAARWSFVTAATARPDAGAHRVRTANGNYLESIRPGAVPTAGKQAAAAFEAGHIACIFCFMRRNRPSILPIMAARQHCTGSLEEGQTWGCL